MKKEVRLEQSHLFGNLLTDVTRGLDFSLRSRRQHKAPREAFGFARGRNPSIINRAIGDSDRRLILTCCRPLARACSSLRRPDPRSRAGLYAVAVSDGLTLPPA